MTITKNVVTLILTFFFAKNINFIDKILKTILLLFNKNREVLNMNVSIDKEIHKKIKVYAASNGIKLSEAVEQSIEFFLKNSNKKESLV